MNEEIVIQWESTLKGGEPCDGCGVNIVEGYMVSRRPDPCPCCGKDRSILDTICADCYMRIKVGTA
jgi:hypothetical protein